LEWNETRACSKHFTSDDFQECYFGLTGELRRTLKKYAVPSLYLEKQDPLASSTIQQTIMEENNELSSFPLFEDLAEEIPEPTEETLEPLDPIENDLRFEIHQVFEEQPVIMETQPPPLQDVTQECTKCTEHEETIQKQEAKIQELENEIFSLKSALAKLI
jgi:hypothetical protein